MGNYQYDYLIVGGGLFGSVFAREATDRGKKCLIIDRREHTGGNLYCKEVEGINMHYYGAHIFHTSNEEVWEYANRFVKFNHYINSPVANYKGEMYNLPFNMNTFSKMWNISKPEEAMAIINEQRKELGDKEPENLEEQAISLIGRDIYEKLIKGYTEKQWGRPCTEIPAFIIKRLPVRLIYDNNYFNDTHQGIPIGGYNELIKGLQEGIEVRLNTNYFEHREELEAICKQTLFTGMIDEYYDYCFGRLEYRSLQFEHEILDMENYQGNAVVNYTEADIPYTRILEHKHFEFGTQEKTIITKEYPREWQKGDEPYYPINDKKNNEIYAKYAAKAKEENILFGGRLAGYKYYDMDDTIEAALAFVKDHFKD